MGKKCPAIFASFGILFLLFLPARGAIPSSDRILVQKAEELFNEKAYFESRKLWNRLSKKYRANSSFLFRIGQTYEFSGLKKIAISFYKKALDRDPQNPKIQRSIADLKKFSTKTLQKSPDFFYQRLLKEPNLFNLLRLQEYSEPLPEKEKYSLYSELSKRFPEQAQIKEWLLPFYWKKAYQARVEILIQREFQKNSEFTETLFRRAEDSTTDSEQWFTLLQKLSANTKNEIDLKRRILFTKMEIALTRNPERLRELTGQIDSTAPQTLKQTDLLFRIGDLPEYTFSIYKILSEFVLRQEKPGLALLLSENRINFQNFLIQKLQEEKQLSDSMRVLRAKLVREPVAEINSEFLAGLSDFFSDPEGCIQKLEPISSSDPEAEILKFLCLGKTEKKPDFLRAYQKLNPENSLSIFSGPAVDFAWKNSDFELIQKILSQSVRKKTTTREMKRLYARALYETTGGNNDAFRFYEAVGRANLQDSDRFPFADLSFRYGLRETADTILNSILQNSPYHLYANYLSEKIKRKTNPQQAFELTERILFLSEGKWDLEEQFSGLTESGIDLNRLDPFRAYQLYRQKRYEEAEALFQKSENALNENFLYVRYLNLWESGKTELLARLQKKNENSLANRAFQIREKIPTKKEELEDFLLEHPKLLNGFYFSAELAEKVLKKKPQFSDPKAVAILLSSADFMNPKQIYRLASFLEKAKRNSEALQMADYLGRAFQNNPIVKKLRRKLLLKSENLAGAYE